MSFEDKTIVCVDCAQEFIHSAEDQSRYAERGFTNEPKRCRDCRQQRKSQRGGGGGGGRGRPRREFHDAVCAECGTQTTVPFKPTGDRPVYCRDCFQAQRQ
ncbi:MAG: zinc-ribbon domain containing protein [Planctomycetota bacterium]|nr:MAG: zinc-ribbon domain containing protein [Planctomycetota bacterium]